MKTLAVYTAYEWDHALVELRVTGPAREAGLDVLRGTEGPETRPELVSQADLVILQRDFPRDTAGYARVVQLARSRGVPVVYDLDDLIFDLPPDHPDRAIHYYTDALVPMLEALTAADAVTASTTALCAELATYHPYTFHLPNYLLDSHWSLRPLPEPNPDGPLTIGYMGGTSHAPDLQAIGAILRDLADEYGDQIRLHFWGASPPTVLRPMPNVQWTDLDLRYPALAAYMGEQTCDVFIAPLQDNLFNRCKSPVKFLEYSALGVPGVYSRVGPYADAITHGQDGFLASTRSEWESALRLLIEDPSARREVGVRAQETVRNHWLLSQHASRWPETYTRIKSLAAVQPDPAREQAVADKIRGFQEDIRAWQSAQAQKADGVRVESARPGRLRERLAETLARLRRKVS